MLEEQKATAQQTLDDLFNDNLIPFQLSARVIDSIGGDEYIVRFHGSRLRSVDLSWRQDQSFKDVFRVAMLERLKRVDGSCKKLDQAG